MKDKVSKKRIGIDYLALIKGHGLYWSFLRWRKHLSPKIKSKNRQRYLFCMSFLYKQLQEIKQFNNDVDFMNKDGVRMMPWND